MKRFNHLYERITSFDNLLQAAKNAQKGKRYNAEVATFQLKLEENLLHLSETLGNKTYQPGQYRTFMIYDPKERMISAAPYRDRVVHHALCQVIEPIFEKSFIYDSYANRSGKGSHKAISRYQTYARQYPYVLKCDIRKFFPSIDHQILKQAIEKKIRCKSTNWLMQLIIDNANKQEEHIIYFPGDDLFTPYQRKKGLPIGNLTSQFWGNVYLDGLDHYIKEQLRVPAYVRYVDDFVLLGESKQQMWQWKQQIEHYLQGLRLILHPNKTQIHQTKEGIPFLGFMTYPYYKYVRKEKIRRYRRYLRNNLDKRSKGCLQPQTLEDQLNAWLGHIKHGQCKRLENTIFNYLRRQGVELHRSPSGSWRVLEQQRQQLSGFQPQQQRSK